jgi:hypothetical protein
MEMLKRINGISEWILTKSTSILCGALRGNCDLKSNFYFN